jgi:tRNA pseudouridine38-40 synthase
VKPAAWRAEVLSAKSRRAAAETAPPDGLYLVEVKYPEPYIFPIPNKVFLL